VLAGGPAALGIIPLGTINRLARDLGIPLDCASAAQALARPEIRAIDVAEVNGRVFLCNSFLGLPPGFTEARQQLRGKPLLERLAGYVSATSQVLASTRRLALSIDDGVEETNVRAITLAVANNAYSDTPSLLLKRDALDRGELALYVMRHKSGWGVALAVVRAMLGIWRNDPAIEFTKAHRIEIRSRRRRLRLSNDGEVEAVPTPLVYTIRPRSLRVLVPAAT
jgi:diacylglycerol kinase family enzyme